jgi:hypothetical protein
MRYTAADRIIIRGVDIDDMLISTQQVSQTEMWRSATVRVTIFGGDATVKQSDTSIISSNNRLKFLRFRTADAQIQVSTCTVVCTWFSRSSSSTRYVPCVRWR